MKARPDKPKSSRPESVWEVTGPHLLALPIGQVTLGQNKATGANVGLTPGSNQPDVLLHKPETQLLSQHSP